MKTARLLLAVDLSESPSIPGPFLELVRSVELVLLGMYEVPEQTAPAQAKDQYEEESTRKLKALVRDVEAAGGVAESRMVFTGRRIDTIDRIAREMACDAVCELRPMEELERILVPIKSARHYWVPEFVADLVEEDGVEILLYHADEEDGGDTKARMLQTIKQRLIREGTDPNAVRAFAEHTSDRSEAIVAKASEYDLLVIGETETTLAGRLFGELHEEVAEAVSCPVIVVRRPPSAR